jgi:acetyl-CoA acetyltransferase
MRDATAIVGVGATPFYRRGGSYPETKLELACKAILAALEDAGLTVRDVDGFTYYSGGRSGAAGIPRSGSETTTGTESMQKSFTRTGG